MDVELEFLLGSPGHDDGLHVVRWLRLLGQVVGAGHFSAHANLAERRRIKRLSRVPQRVLTHLAEVHRVAVRIGQCSAVVDGQLGRIDLIQQGGRPLSSVRAENAEVADRLLADERLDHREEQREDLGSCGPQKDQT